MRQLTTRKQMTTTLSTIDHSTAFDNDQSLYRIISYKWLRKDNCKQFKRENSSLLYVPSNPRQPLNYKLSKLNMLR